MILTIIYVFPFWTDLNEVLGPVWSWFNRRSFSESDLCFDFTSTLKLRFHSSLSDQKPRWFSLNVEFYLTHPENLVEVLVLIWNNF